MKARKSSDYYGVTYHEGSGQRPYHARIQPRKGQNFYGGIWPTEREAAIAVDRMILHLKLDRPLNLPRTSRKLGPKSPEDLRILSKAESKARRHVGRFLGVAWNREHERWEAKIYLRDRQQTVFLGRFDEEEDAAIAYDRVVLKLLSAEEPRNFPTRKFKPASIEEMREHSRKLLKEGKSSRYRGVYLSTSETWVAQVYSEGRVTYLGSFESEEDAARAYDRAARKIWGKAAKLNGI